MLVSSIITTRTSVAARSRGCSDCQLSNTPRRIRSPAARLISTATRVIASQATSTRPRCAFASEADFESVIATNHLQRRTVAGQLLVADGFPVHPLDILVVIGRLVVEQGERLRLRLVAEV